MFVNYFFRLRFWSLSLILFFFSDLSVCLIWVSLIFMALTVIPFSLLNLEEESSSGYLKYILFQESYSVLLCIFLYFYFNVFIFLIGFLKLAVAPLGNWMEPLLKEIKSGFSWIITIPKLIPSFLLFCFINSVFLSFIVLIGFLCLRKLLILKNFQSIILYMGNFSVLFCVILRFYSFFFCSVWFVIYIILSFFLLNSQVRFFSCSFSFFFWMSALPPSPIFFLKFYLLTLLGALRNKIIVLFLLLRIFLFFVIWDLTSKNSIKGIFSFHDDSLALFYVFVTTVVLYFVF